MQKPTMHTHHVQYLPSAKAKGGLMQDYGGPVIIETRGLDAPPNVMNISWIWILVKSK